MGKPHLKDGAIIYSMPGMGGSDYIAREVIADEMKSGKVTFAGIVPMPLNCRISDWGKRVDLASLKDSYDLAAIPARNAKKAAADLSGLLGGRPVKVIGNYVGINLHSSNPQIHPGRIYSLFKDYTVGKIYPEN